MKSTYLLLLLLLFFPQAAFSQDYSKMSANEKAKVIIYGDLYPYSLLLESGSDTLHLYQPPIDLHLFFEEGKLVQINNDKGEKTLYLYEGERVVSKIQESDTVLYDLIYKYDTLIGIAPKYSFMEKEPLYDSNTVCESVNFSIECVHYNENRVFYNGNHWIFEKDKIINEFHPMGIFPNFDNYKKTFFVKNGYVNIVSEDLMTREQLENEFTHGDFESKEKHELKIKILKSPKDKIKKVKEEIIEVENEIEID
ncbi:hypothetical protein ACE193_17795 [Bernardetia sp. OM2101]|uniref:hypothetical protein n=1 Tax=Bernardetia sp. OM2101 TaxID=3344876 RepID=UPI0035D12F5D